MKRVFACMLALLLLASSAILFASAETEKEDTQMNKKHYGLHVEADGTMTLEGKAFYGFGLNYFGAFAHSYYDEGETPAYVAAFAAIREHNIPFVRLPLCGYYPDYYERFDEDPEPLFACMKSILDTAEQNQVGVIVSLMWWDPAIALHVGGKRSDMGKEDSAVLEYAKKYSEAVVSRFADHPAVWGWEIGNEYNLNADLCDPEYKQFLWDMNYPGTERTDVDGYDYYTSTELAYFYAEIGKVIRKYDNYRMITTGNGEMRPYAYALFSAAKKANDKHLWTMKWDIDKLTKFNTINAIYTPDPLDTMCFHLQHGTGGSQNPAYELEFERFYRTVSSLEYFKAYADAAKAQSKALFFGEFGDMRDMEGAPDAIDKFREVAGWITEAGIQLAASWQFQDYTEEGINGQKLDALSDFNVDLRKNGKQELSAAWAEHTVIHEDTTDSSASSAETTVPTTADAKTTTGTASASGCGSATVGSAVITGAVGTAAVLIAKKKKKADQ